LLVDKGDRTKSRTLTKEKVARTARTLVNCMIAVEVEIQSILQLIRFVEGM
jgi:hypothetical protein